jgi:hypothetical protein
MIRFQLIFRERDGERAEVWNDNRGGAPTIHGKLIVDGETYVIGGKEWVIWRERGRSQEIARFVCTPVALSSAPSNSVRLIPRQQM